MKQGRRPVALTIMAILVGMLFVLPAAPAFAVDCTLPGAGCEGENPQGTGCSGDAKPLQTTAIMNGQVELRWSLLCRTVWSRVTSWIGATTIRTRIQRQSGSPLTYDDIDYNTTQAYNDKMMYVNLYFTHYRACGRVGADSTWHCTDWH